MPDKIVPEMMITLGYAAEDLKAPLKDGPELKTYFEKWGKKEADFDIWNLTKQAEKLRKSLKKVEDKGKGKIRALIESVKKKREDKRKTKVEREQAEEEAAKIEEEKEAKESY